MERVFRPIGCNTLDSRRGEAMRKVVLKMSVSVDGFVAGPNGEIDWMFRSRDPRGKEWVADTIGRAGVHIMGRRTYQDWVGFWPYSTDALAAPMNRIPKVVFTRKGIVAPSASKATDALKDAASATTANRACDPEVLKSWTDARVARGDLKEEIRLLKEESGDYILAQGGAGFASSLAASGLIDEFRLVIHPVALGSGLALFQNLPEPLHLRLAGSIDFGSGAVARIYERT